MELKASRVVLGLSAFVTFLNFLPLTKSSKKCELNDLLRLSEIFRDLNIEPEDCLKPLHVKFPALDSYFPPGSDLELQRVKHEPVILNLHDFLRDNEVLSIVMVDPDAPSRDYPKHREFLHWWVQYQGQDKFESLMDFMASSPPRGTGKHRYIFLAFSDKVENSKEALHLQPEKRPDFKVASKHLGQLVGATFYLTQNE